MLHDLSSTCSHVHPIMGSYGELVCDESKQKLTFCFSISMHLSDEGKINANKPRVLSISASWSWEVGAIACLT